MKTRAPELPAPIREAFEDVALLPTSRVAKLLGLPPEGLLDMVKERNLPSRTKGLGRVRPRKVFGIDDVAAIWHYMSAKRH